MVAYLSLPDVGYEKSAFDEVAVIFNTLSYAMDYSFANVSHCEQ
jgi:hypothetical protein